MDSLLEPIGEELSMEDLEDLENQRRQLEEEMEAGQHPMTPPRKEMTIEVLQDFIGLFTPCWTKWRLWTRILKGRGSRDANYWTLWPSTTTLCRRGGGQLCRAPSIVSLRRNPPPLTPLLQRKASARDLHRRLYRPCCFAVVYTIAVVFIVVRCR